VIVDQLVKIFAAFRLTETKVHYRVHNSPSYVVMRNACDMLVRKPEGTVSLGRPRCKLEDNIKMDLDSIRCEVMDWIHLAQNSIQ
jgi:hypothetical protein